MPIILQNFEQTNFSLTKKKIQERSKKQNRQRITECNREDATIVWVYDDKTMNSDSLLIIQRKIFHLFRLFHRTYNLV